MTTIEQYALSLVQRVIAEREEARRIPAVALLRDIARIATAEISEALERMTEQGILQRTENINKIPMYAPKDQQA